ncbi:MAG: hypothetical protein ABIY86_11470 [Rhodoferax sp.]
MFSVHTIRHTAVVAGILVLGASLTPAFAAESSDSAPAHSEALDNLSISIGDYVVSPNANLTINTPFGSASTGDVSSHQVQIPRLKADFLLGHSQGFALDYYGFYRQYSDSVNRTYSTGPNDINFSANANANVNLDLANASYKWWFGSGSDVVGVGVGLAYYRVRFGVDGTAATNINNASSSANASYSTDAVAPLVQLGWRHAFSPNTRMYVDLSGIEKSGGDLSGHIYNASLGAEWYFAKNFGIGAEYSSTQVKVDGDGSNGNLDLKMDGPTVYLKARF